MGTWQPTKEAVRCAEPSLHRSYQCIAQKHELLPMAEGETALDPPSGYKQSNLLQCPANGSVHCTLYLHGVHQTITFESEQVLPEQFLRETLLLLHVTVQVEQRTHSFPNWDGGKTGAGRVLKQGMLEETSSSNQIPVIGFRAAKRKAFRYFR